MTSAMSHEMAFGSPPKPVYAPQREGEFDVSKWASWQSGLTMPTVERKTRHIRAICEPIVELLMWHPRNGVVSSLVTGWDAAQAEDGDMLEDLLTLDLTIPVEAHIRRTVAIQSPIVSAQKWSPPVLDPELYIDLED
jgi:hypothetical protein